MKLTDHSIPAMDGANRQIGNQQWWTDQTMSYDWKDKVASEKYTLPWYDEIDRRFVWASRLFTDPQRPFANLMRTDQLDGARVLEVGCGMGFHSELLTRAGANLTSIDLSPTSVESTQRRFALKGLAGDIRGADAERLPFEDGEFDFVWSWGVIHHSASTSRALREIRRVLKPGGAAGIMVYGMDGIAAYTTIFRHYLTGFWRGRSIDELLWKYSDGFSARFYTRDNWTDLVSLMFEVEDLRQCAQDVDVMPVPRQIRPLLLKMLSPERQRELGAKRGSMLFSRLRAV